MVVVAMALMLIVIVMVSLVGRRTASLARVRTAADAAALAGAIDDGDAARSVAAANGASLTGLSVDESADAVEVTAQASIDGVTASARSREIVETVTVLVDAGVGVSAGGLTAEMLAAIARAEELLGEPIPIVSGYRSTAAQQALWDNRHNNPYPVALPGTSNHERGLAIDVPSSFVHRLLSVAAEAGLCQPLPVTDRIHFELCGIR